MQKISTYSNLFSGLLFGLLTLSLSLTVGAKPLSNADTVSKSTTVTAPSKVTKKPKSSKTGKKLSSVPAANAKEAEPDVQDHTSTAYKCELGNTLVMYAQANDDDNLSMRWKNNLYRMSRVSTSTGAQRFENQKNGFVWIDIPAKGMLLDSLRGRQLANECKRTM